MNIVNKYSRIGKAILLTIFIGSLGCEKEKLDNMVVGKNRTDILTLCFVKIGKPLHIDVNHFVFELNSINDLSRYRDVATANFWEIQVSDGNILQKKKTLGIHFDNGGVCKKAEILRTKAI